MTTVKIKIRTSSVPHKEGTLYYIVTHQRITKWMSTDYKIYPDEWNNRNGQICLPEDKKHKRYLYLNRLKACVEEDTARLQSIIARFERTGKVYTANQIVQAYLTMVDSSGFLSFGRRLVSRLRDIGKVRTAEHYATSLNSFERFRGKDGDIAFDQLDALVMTKYEVHLRTSGLCPNSTSYYMRNLRAIYNRAVEEGITPQRAPFRHTYTGVDKTVKRAVSLETIRQIRDCDLSDKPSMAFARDMFMFSFYTRGMSFVDMAFLRKRDLRDGILSYRRRKTGQLLIIRWEKAMQEIVGRYDTFRSPFLLPIIRNMQKDARKQYESTLRMVNRQLKALGNLLGVGTPLTTYVARHGWASIAKSKNIPLSIISEAMGHDSESTTRIYLASLSTSVVDQANSLILDSL